MNWVDRVWLGTGQEASRAKSAECGRAGHQIHKRAVLREMGLLAIKSAQRE